MSIFSHWIMHQYIKNIAYYWYVNITTASPSIYTYYTHICVCLAIINSFIGEAFKQFLSIFGTSKNSYTVEVPSVLPLKNLCLYPFSLWERPHCFIWPSGAYLYSWTKPGSRDHCFVLFLLCVSEHAEENTVQLRKFRAVLGNQD